MRRAMRKTVGWGIAFGVLGLGPLSMACLDPPQLMARDTAVADGAMAPFAVTEVRAHALDGSRWPDDAIPRRPRIEIELSRELDEPPPIYLLAMAPTDALLDDLRSSPLRAEHLGRAIACDVHRERGRLELTPILPLAAGAEITLAIGAWARSGRESLGTAYLHAFSVSAAFDAGASATASWPPDGASDVGTDLRTFIVRFDGELRAIDRAVILEGPLGPITTRPERIDCEAIGATGFCIALSELGALAPLTRYVARIDEAIDATGAPLASWSSSFRTAEGEDRSPPVLGEVSCAIDEALTSLGCVLATDERIELRLQAGEPVIATLRSASTTIAVAAPRGSARLRLLGLVDDEDVPLTLSLRDLTGRSIEHRFTAHTTPRLPRVSISEVRADPLGREPTQEYVELLNEDDHAIDLAGFHLADGLDREGDALPPFLLSPGARVLVVATAFDPDDGSDGPIPPGAVLLRIGTSLGDAGLTNSGEPLVLRDPDQARLSFVPALPSPAGGACLVRTSDDARSDDPDHFTYATDACSPGR